MRSAIGAELKLKGAHVCVWYETRRGDLTTCIERLTRLSQMKKKKTSDDTRKKRQMDIFENRKVEKRDMWTHEGSGRYKKEAALSLPIITCGHKRRFSGGIGGCVLVSGGVGGLEEVTNKRVEPASLFGNRPRPLLPCLRLSLRMEDW